MPGQPNRRPVSERPPTDPTGKAMPVGHGVPGSHEIDAFWADTDDPRVLKDRLRRYKAQVEKAKQDRRDLREALKLKTEEAYIEGLLANAAKWQEIDAAITDIVHQAASGPIDEDALKVLKGLAPVVEKQRERAYGKVRQRVSTTSVSASVDINRLQESAQAAARLGAGSGDPEVIDVEDAEVVGDA